MDKWQQKFSIGYFFIALILLFLLQTYLASPQVETINYSQFKTLVKKGMVANITVGEKSIHGEIKPEGAKQALPPERLKAWEETLKEGKKPVPFLTVRVEDAELVTDWKMPASRSKVKSSTNGYQPCSPGWCRSSCSCSCGISCFAEWGPAAG